MKMAASVGQAMSEEGEMGREWLGVGTDCNIRIGKQVRQEYVRKGNYAEWEKGTVM